MAEKIIVQDLSESLGKNYVDYAMSVIASRALPDVRDGLKPVLRRILFSMNETGNTYNKPYRKSARTVGDTMGKYHPHGDSSIYEGMVNNTQKFKTRYPLIDGQGNFGNLDGDGAAAMRYTEARMSKIGATMLNNIHKNNVDFVPNFDNSLMQPKVLPTLVPYLLASGVSGIAVGMSTNMLPHNLTELYTALEYIIDCICEGNEPETEEVLNIVKGPDFPLGGQIVGIKGIRNAYLTGKGKIKMRAVYHEEKRKGNALLVFTELPYKINKANLVDEIYEASQSRIEEIKDVKDESDKDGVRVVVELKKDVDPTLVVNKLYKFTGLESCETINNLALVHGRPQVLTLMDIFKHFLEHSIEVVQRETNYDLEKCLQRLSIVTAMIWAVSEENTEQIISIIRSSDNQAESQTAIAELYKACHNGEKELTQEQAKAIAEMRLRQLTKDSITKFEDEKEQLTSTIEKYQLILSDQINLLKEVKCRYTSLKEEFGDERRTAIIQDDDDLDIEDLIKDETLILTYTSEGIIKTVEESNYNTTNRGTKGIKGSSINEDECITHLQAINSKDHLFFFTNTGRCLTLRAFMIPKSSRTARGKYIGNYLQLQEDEKVVGFIAADKNEEQYFFLTTKNGIVKRLSFEDLPKRANGGVVINIRDNDELVSIKVVKEADEVVITTAKAMSIRFKVEDVRPMGRTATGVRGIKLRENDYVVDTIVVNESEKILTVTQNGLAKQSVFEDYRVASRGGIGIITHKLTDRTGDLVCALSVQEDDEVLVATQQGQIIRTRVSAISTTGRSTSGVILVSLYDGDSIVSVSKIKPQQDAIEEEGE